MTYRDPIFCTVNLDASFSRYGTVLTFKTGSCFGPDRGLHDTPGLFWPHVRPFQPNFQCCFSGIGQSYRAIIELYVQFIQIQISGSITRARLTGVA